jgi:hypothetical protein
MPRPNKDKTDARNKAAKHDDKTLDRLGGKDPLVDPTDDVQEPLASWRDDVDNG